MGPSTANFPDILTFSGAAYTTSGRITALAIDPSCSTRRCRAWAAAAGGGVWRTDKALAGSGVKWTFVSGNFATNSIGTLTFDADRNTLYAGTGEPNSSGDSEAGFGIYKSTDGGDTWAHLAANTSVPAGAGVDCTCAIGGGAFGSHPRIAARLSMAVRSPLSSLILATRTLCTFHPIAAHAESAQWPEALPCSLRSSAYGLWKSTGRRGNLYVVELIRMFGNPTLPETQEYPGNLRLYARRPRDQSRPGKFKYSLRRSVPFKQRLPT